MSNIQEKRMESAMSDHRRARSERRIPFHQRCHLTLVADQCFQPFLSTGKSVEFWIIYVWLPAKGPVGARKQLAHSFELFKSGAISWKTPGKGSAKPAAWC